MNKIETNFTTEQLTIVRNFINEYLASSLCNDDGLSLLPLIMYKDLCYNYAKEVEDNKEGVKK